MIRRSERSVAAFTMRVCLTSLVAPVIGVAPAERRIKPHRQQARARIMLMPSARSRLAFTRRNLPRMVECVPAVEIHFGRGVGRRRHLDWPPTRATKYHQPSNQDDRENEYPDARAYQPARPREIPVPAAAPA